MTFFLPDGTVKIPSSLPSLVQVFRARARKRVRTRKIVCRNKLEIVGWAKSHHVNSARKK